MSATIIGAFMFTIWVILLVAYLFRYIRLSVLVCGAAFYTAVNLALWVVMGKAYDSIMHIIIVTVTVSYIALLERGERKDDAEEDENALHRQR